MLEKLLIAYIHDLKLSSLARKIPNISEENAEFLKGLIRERKPRHILEIGTANGYSTLCFAEVIVGGGKKLTTDNGQLTTDVTTIEYAENAYIEAVKHFEATETTDIITSLFGDAKKIIPTLPESHFDFVFIDAMKREYLDYLLLSLPKMTPDALIVIDDVIKFRPKMENLYKYLDENHIKYTIHPTDPDDGVMLLYKKDIGISKI